MGCLLNDEVALGTSLGDVDGVSLEDSLVVVIGTSLGDADGVALGLVMTYGDAHGLVLGVADGIADGELLNDEVAIGSSLGDADLVTLGGAIYVALGT